MMTKNNTLQGHLAAFLTIFIWGTTFISTKVLLKSFGPIEILFIRFLIGYLALWIGCPHRKRKGERKEELYFAVAGPVSYTHLDVYKRQVQPGLTDKRKGKRDASIYK